MCNFLYVGAGGDISFMIIALLIMAIPWIVGIWLVVELIKWLRRH